MMDSFILAALALCSLTAPACGDKGTSKARSCSDIRQFYSGKGFALDGVPQSEISVAVSDKTLQSPAPLRLLDLRWHFILVPSAMYSHVGVSVKLHAAAGLPLQAGKQQQLLLLQRGPPARNPEQFTAYPPLSGGRLFNVVILEEFRRCSRQEQRPCSTLMNLK
ncbi:Glypican-1 [Liparis tanakae]|uniref:Glypican-1 n=1 Tax=Liparis tanakae TaxID=230148 RepID=A0A4Z2G3Y6_9TELE|nr:Glypican-1 [Liparis tanakae]